MAMSNNEMLEYLIAYIDNEIEQASNDHEKTFTVGEIEGILFMLEVFNCDKMASMLDKKYRHLYNEWS